MKCVVCNKSITKEQQDDRHELHEPECGRKECDCDLPCHAECCPECSPVKRFGPPDGRDWMGWSWTEKEDDLPQKNLAVAHFEDRHGYSPREIHEESERRYMWLGPVGPAAETKEE